VSLAATISCVALGTVIWQVTTTNETKPTKSVTSVNPPPMNLPAQQGSLSDEWHSESIQQTITTLENELQGMKNEVESEF
jgi:hypothetical protein